MVAGTGITLGALAAAPAAGAADFTVTTLADAGPGSLRQALQSANSQVGADRILFRSGLSGTINLSDRLVASDAVQILGPGASRLTLRGGAFHILEVDYGPPGTPVAVSGLTFTGSSPPSPQNGGAIANFNGDLTVSDSVVTGNDAERGGGIYGDSPIQVRDSTVSGNSSTYPGGGIFSQNSTVTVERSTISGNTSGSNGGGISGFQSDITLTSSTVAGNHAVGPYPGGGVAVAGGGATGTLTNTIVANNTAPNDPDIFEGVGSSVSASFSLVEDPGNTTISPGSNLTGVDPKLGPLQDNGGPTRTHAVLPGSPAIDKGMASGADQRGAPRPFNLPGVPSAGAPGANAADIGAYERVLCGGVAVNRVGTAGKDKLRGTGGRDGILGLAGRDRLLGLGGNDALCGGAGGDLLRGGAGRDKLLGQAGRDRLLGGPGRDRLIGGPGADRLIGGPGRDRLRGGPGKDRQRQ